MTEKKIRMATSEKIDDRGHTIVGGRPQTAKNQRTDIPRGLELLIKKASADDSFKNELLIKKEKLIDELNLALDISEKAMLAAVPTEHLRKMIEATELPQSQKKALAKVSTAAMVALVAQLAFAPVAGKADTPEANSSQNHRIEDSDFIEKNQKPVHSNIVKGIRPDENENAAPSGEIDPIINDFDSHLADRGVRPDFPKELKQMLNEQNERPTSILDNPEPPLEQSITIDIRGKNIKDAVSELSGKCGLKIQVSGLDEAIESYPLQSDISGKTLAEALKSICNEAAGKDYSYNCSLDQQNKTMTIKFEKSQLTPPLLEPLIKPDYDDSAICRGIRFDMPEFKRKLPDIKTGEDK
ncbi:MAG: hypothetical protein Kow0029_30520 [Candidatus Rifleibacteriota bacterium]